MDRFIKDNKVGVALSKGLGAGWYTWNQDLDEEDRSELVFDPWLIKLIEDNASEKLLTMYAERMWPRAFMQGLEKMKVEWVPKGTRFSIDELYGNETININGKDLEA